MIISWDDVNETDDCYFVGYIGDIEIQINYFGDSFSVNIENQDSDLFELVFEEDYKSLDELTKDVEKFLSVKLNFPTIEDFEKIYKEKQK